MNLKRRHLLAGASTLAFGGFLNGFPKIAFAETPVKGGTMVVGQHQNNIKTLDASLGVQPDERPVMYAIYNSLVSIASDFSLQPELATEWVVENEGARYVITLRSGVTFHDDTPFDAEAVKYNLETRLDPANNSPHRSQLSAAIDSIEVVDPMTVAVNLKFPWPGLMAILSDRAGLGHVDK
ncbi:ABC transporter substrate-binding protein [Paracoccus onubensis]|uniref:Solute-binding protein family 5 domain-containing protein n=1 Tax=Paracoccus onubensis TaxID=1675788 RepID=A0A418SUM9_9RHOB|nr:ABC transporter substrate-binding protein [Paracoccus onubensis]RJE84609.1 hypothetical protein D3P04_13280 [Paracoccus onubensis]